MKCSEWNEYTIGESCELLTGFAFKSKEYLQNGKYRVIRGDNVKIGFIYWEEKSRFLDVIDDKLEKYLLNIDDIVIGMDGSRVGKNRAIVQEKDLPAVLAQRVACLRAKSERFDQEYIKHIIMSSSFEKYVESIKTGTSIPHISLKQISDFKFKAPILEEQIKISSILSSLDKKIQLNNEMNKTLEEMAQALFKRWFVDFEFPNEEGEPYKASGGEMVESELGMIPKGWIVKKLGELGKVITGKTPSTKCIENYGDKYNFITPVDMKDESYVVNSQRKLSEVGYEKVKQLIIKENSIGVTCIGSNLGEVYINAEESFTNQQINSLIPENEKYFSYIYIVLKNMKNDFLNIAGGSAVPIINKSTFSDIKIIVPYEKLLNDYCNKMNNIFERIKSNLIQNNTLIELRDTLLPKLMSGEIRIEDIEASL